MAELGSHQLDACSIFLGKTRTNHVHPIAVTAVGGKNFYHDEREVEDQVFCIFEFPGPQYDPQRPAMDNRGRQNYQNLVTVTYSSISTNGFEPYGECVMGTQGTLVVESEQNVMLWGGAGRSTAVTVNTTGGRPALDSSASTDGAGERRATDTGQNAIGHAPPSRGYREEMEHFAYCIRMRDQGMDRDREELQPRCDGRAAMDDAIIALTANQAIRTRSRIVFDSRWFDPASSEVPDRNMRERQL
jgi:predicted dehydrogenase